MATLRIEKNSIKLANTIEEILTLLEGNDPIPSNYNIKSKIKFDGADPICICTKDDQTVIVHDDDSEVIYELDKELNRISDIFKFEVVGDDKSYNKHIEQFINSTITDGYFNVELSSWSIKKYNNGFDINIQSLYDSKSTIIANSYITNKIYDKLTELYPLIKYEISCDNEYFKNSLDSLLKNIGLTNETDLNIITVVKIDNNTIKVIDKKGRIATIICVHNFDLIHSSLMDLRIPKHVLSYQSLSLPNNSSCILWYNNDLIKEGVSILLDNISVKDNAGILKLQYKKIHHIVINRNSIEFIGNSSRAILDTDINFNIPEFLKCVRPHFTVLIDCDIIFMPNEEIHSVLMTLLREIPLTVEELEIVNNISNIMFRDRFLELSYNRCDHNISLFNKLAYHLYERLSAAKPRLYNGSFIINNTISKMLSYFMRDKLKLSVDEIITHSDTTEYKGTSPKFTEANSKWGANLNLHTGDITLTKLGN